MNYYGDSSSGYISPINMKKTKSSGGGNSSNSFKFSRTYTDSEGSDDNKEGEGDDYDGNPWAPQNNDVSPPHITEITALKTMQTHSYNDEGATNNNNKKHDTVNNYMKWKNIKQGLKEKGVKYDDIKYLDSMINRNPFKHITLNSAIYELLEYKKIQAQEGMIKNKGVDNDPYINFKWSKNQKIVQLPQTMQYKDKINKMNNNAYNTNIIKWSDYILLRVDDVVDYRNDEGKFILAKIVDKQGINMILYTQESHTISINFLDQYPYKRLFHGGAVTERIPKQFEDQSVKIGAPMDIFAGFISHEYWYKVSGEIIKRDTDHKNGEQIKQVQVKFCPSNCTDDIKDEEKTYYSQWVHLDNKQETHYEYVVIVCTIAAAMAAEAVLHEMAGGGGMGQGWNHLRGGPNHIYVNAGGGGGDAGGGGGGGGGSHDHGDDCCGYDCDDCCDCDGCCKDCDDFFNCNNEDGCCPFCGGGGDCGDCDCCKCDGCCDCDCDGCCDCDCDCDCGGCDCDCGGCNCVVM